MLSPLPAAIAIAIATLPLWTRKKEKHFEGKWGVKSLGTLCQTGGQARSIGLITV